MTKIATFWGLLLLCACRDERPPAPTSEESAQLNEMEKALNAMSEYEEGPANRSAGPSNSSDEGSD